MAKEMIDQLKRLHAYLLPADLGLGVGPYIWLFYSCFLWIPIFTDRVSGWAVVLSVVSFVPFLALYFAGFRCTGWKLRFIVAGMAILGLLVIPVNWGAMTYFVFAGCFCAFVGPPREALVTLLGVLALFCLEWWLLDAPLRSLLITLLVTTIVACANMVFRAIHMKDLALRASKEEVARLATLNERERIARDLHDVLGHTLSSITLKAALAVRLAESDPERARVEMEEVEVISRKALTQARTAVSGYRSASVRDEIGRGRMLLADAGVDLQTSLDDDFALPAEWDNVLGLAVREALTNVARHARAAACRIKVRQRDGGVVIVVADDGRGGECSPGAGLSGMTERLASLGGDVSISSSRAGTKVTLRVPRQGEGATVPTSARPLSV